MKNTAYTVGLVVDRAFGERVVELSERMHVWLIESPANRAAAERVWARVDEEAGRDPLEYGVTTFQAPLERSPEDAAAEIISTIAEHHSEWEHDPPMTVLEVYGARRTRPLESALADIGLFISLQEDGRLVYTASEEMPEQGEHRD